MIKQCLILFISNIIFWIQRIGARAYTNNLPLALVPIGHSPKTEGPNMTLMLWPCQLLGQRISYVVLSRNLAYLHISSFDDLRMRWNPLSMCLDFWCDRCSLACAMAPLLSQ